MNKSASNAFGTAESLRAWLKEASANSAFLSSFPLTSQHVSQLFGHVRQVEATATKSFLFLIQSFISSSLFLLISSSHHLLVSSLLFSSHLLIFSSPHLIIFSSSHLLVFSSSSHHLIFSSSRLLNLLIIIISSGQDKCRAEALQCLALLSGGGGAELVAQHPGVWRQLAPPLSRPDTKDFALAVLAALLLAASASAAKRSCAGKALLPPLVALLADEMQPIGTRSAAADALNLLVAQCRPNCALLLSCTDWPELVAVLARCSDFFLQSVVFEILVRASRNTNQIPALAAALGDAHANCAALLAATPSEDFRATTRNFLRQFNANLGEHQRVFSMQTTDTKQWIDFGVVDMSVSPLDDDENIDENPQIVPYISVRNVRLSDGQLSIWLNDNAHLTFLFSDTDAAVLNDRVLGQIRAVSAASGMQKTSIAILSLPIPPANSDPSPVPPPPPPPRSPSPVPIVSKNVEATPASFVAPLRKTASQSLAAIATPNLVASSPLVASFMQFGAVLESQLEQERIKWKKESETMLQHLQRGYEKLAKQQVQKKTQKVSPKLIAVDKSRELLKRAADEENAHHERILAELGRAKRSCTDALALVEAAMEAIADTSAKKGHNDDAHRHQAERDNLFRTFAAHMNEE
jgi:hypothetical protein